MLTPGALLEGKVAAPHAEAEAALLAASGNTRTPHIRLRRIGIDLYAGTWLVTAWCHSGTSGVSSGK
jgi:hypothetical protein